MFITVSSSSSCFQPVSQRRVLFIPCPPDPLKHCFVEENRSQAAHLGPLPRARLCRLFLRSNAHFTCSTGSSVQRKSWPSFSDGGHSVALCFLSLGARVGGTGLQEENGFEETTTHAFSFGLAPVGILADMASGPLEISQHWRPGKRCLHLENWLTHSLDESHLRESTEQEETVPVTDCCKHSGGAGLTHCRLKLDSCPALPDLIKQHMPHASKISI